MRQLIKEKVFHIAVPVSTVFSDRLSREVIDTTSETVVLPLTVDDIAQIEQTARTGYATYEEILIKLVKLEFMDDLLDLCEGSSDLQVDISITGKLRVE